MTQTLAERIQHLSNNEITELEEFAEFLIFKRTQTIKESIAEDIPTSGITKLISDSEAFNWLNNTDENVYSHSDGVPVKW